jgi:hypothetical protein
MLTHIVCWKYNHEADEAAREEHRARLRALGEIIEEVESIEVGADILDLERSFDTGLVAKFADRAALDRYTLHEAHQEVVQIGRRIAQRVVSVDFISETP